MVSDFQWKLIIAGSVGGVCAFVSSILVFAILACRHERKLKKRAAERLSRQRLSAQYSAKLAEPSDLVRGLDRVIGTPDLPLPFPTDSNYIRPAFGVGPFWMGQNSVNHDSGCADIESNRTDSALFIQRSFSPLPRSLNGSFVRTLQGDVFPALSHFDVDSSWSHSFDLLSPTIPFPNFCLTQDDNHPIAKSGNTHVTMPSNLLSGDNIWKPNKSHCSDNHIQSSCMEPIRRDCDLQLIEFPHDNNYPRSQHPSCHMSPPSSSDNDDSDPVWIRRTNANHDSSLARSAMDCNGLDAWRGSGNQQFHGSKLLTRDYKSPRSTNALCGRGVVEDISHRNLTTSGSNHVAAKKPTGGYSDPWESRDATYHDLRYSGRISS